MKIHYPVYFALVTILLHGCESNPVMDKEPCDSNSHTLAKEDSRGETYIAMQREYNEINSTAYLERYVVDVINQGSDVLGLPAGSMAAGFSDPSDAQIIAAYVVSIAGKSPVNPEYIQEGSLYYAGNCSGCHGSDGKGMGGAYPDLTLPMLEGIKLKKSALQRQIDAIGEKRAAD
ncbi:c-type cytochrome [Sulfurimonas sp. HSL-1656]|uniref:c-type cytochrome n=1 Tax=Thiomicrolovo subterrani TaxID=3131934 RepID=UPI0031FA3927